MIDEPTQELASLYAFDLLEGAERSAFEARLKQDPELQTLVIELRESASSLSLTAPAATPSPELKERLMAKIGASASRVELTTDNVISFPFARWIPLAAAAGFAILAGFLGKELVSRRGELIALRTETGLAQAAAKDAENRRIAERILFERQDATTAKQIAELGTQLSTANQRVASLTQDLKAQGDLAQFKIAALSSLLGNSPQALAVAVWNPTKQEGVFTVDKLRAANSDEDYELWVIDSQQKAPVSAGVFTVSAEGTGRVIFKTESPIASVAKFAVTREKKGGAPAHGGPKGDVVMVSQ